jgi:ribosomal protein S18 acetylase RimI-like enzyme
MVNVEIVEAYDRLNEVKALFREYAATLEVDLCFQRFEEELALLPGRYAPQTGRLYLALVDIKPAGCIALRRLDEETCEMKRLYVRGDARGLGLGRLLAEKIISDARALGYRQMRLDTLPSMKRAQSLYERLGFTDIPPYCENPVPGVRYMGLTL